MTLDPEFKAWLLAVPPDLVDPDAKRDALAFVASLEAMSDEEAQAWIADTLKEGIEP